MPSHYWLVDDYYDPDPSKPDKVYGKRGGFLPPVSFDPVHFGVPPTVMSTTDTAQLLAMWVAQQVLVDVTGSPEGDGLERDRVSVVLGVAAGLTLLGDMAGRAQRPVWEDALRSCGVDEAEVERLADRISAQYAAWTETTFPGVLGNVVAGRIANRFDFGGTNFTTDAACASSFSALRAAAQELWLHEADLVITGGVDTTNDPYLFMCFSKTPALSPTGRCRPFAADADGTMLGEGLGMFALKRLEDAERDADRIYAVLRGLGASSDGRAKSVFAPRSGGQAKALRRAYAAAGYAPTTVGLMEAHGTGTRAGDAAELSGLQEVFGREGAEPWCALGSVKSQIGHTKSAAAAAGLMKVVYALHHKVLPPTLGVNAPAEALREPGCAFYANTATRPWIAAQPRRASISSFGFGGTNFHLTVEEYAGPRAAHRRVRDLDAELVLVSGVDPADLVDQIDALAAGLGRDGDLQAGLLPFVARETQGRFDPSFPARLAIVARDEADLHGKLERARERVGRGEAFADPGFTTVFRVGRPEPGGLVVLFPGQGSQRLGMGGDLARSFDRARQVWDDDARHPVVGRPLADLVFPAPAQDDESRTLQAAALRATDHAQPALGAASMAAWTLLRPLGLQPMAFAGHSFGEVTALWAGGVLDDGALLEVAAARGATMAEEAARADTPAGMTAVSAPAATLAWVEEHGIVLANLNAPRQTVISGSLEKLDGVEAEMSANGIPFRRLDVATAFHSPFVARAAKSFAERLSGVNLHRAHTPVWSNATAGRYPDEAGDVRDRLARSIGEPVRFAEQIAALYEAGGRHFLEVGPGTVLSTLTGRILGDRPHLAVATDPGGGSEVEGLFAALGALAAHGAALDYEPLWTEFDLGPDPRHAPLPMLAVPVDGANLGRPYPRLDEQGKPIRPRRVAAPIP
ncbi:MAG: beta-ketoacyl synthase N-terminal-like domain-containing protein, partial [Myxococcota bacterium]